MTFRDALKTKDFVVTTNVNLGSVPSAQSVIYARGGVHLITHHF